MNHHLYINIFLFLTTLFKIRMEFLSGNRPNNALIRGSSLFLEILFDTSWITATRSAAAIDLSGPNTKSLEKANLQK